MRRTLVLLLGGPLLLAGCGTLPAPSGPAADPSVTVVAVGDVACPPGRRPTRKQCRQAATARLARSLGPQQVLALGDLQYQTGRFRAFARSYQRSWGRLRSITWPIPGNHEYETRGARGYYRYFQDRQPGAPGYYRRELNGWQLYLLNSNCGQVDCRAERAWLEAEMAAHPSTCSLLAFHHPRFSSGEHRSNARMRKFWDIGHAHHADIALSGHDHDYERFDPMDSAGVVEPDRGIQQFVSGGGGRSLYPRTTTAPGSRVFRKAFGVLELTLRPTGYSWTFRTVAGRVRDSGSAACR